jgi:hypothetical protein
MRNKSFNIDIQDEQDKTNPILFILYIDVKSDFRCASMANCEGDSYEL